MNKKRLNNNCHCERVKRAWQTGILSFSGCETAEGPYEIKTKEFFGRSCRFDLKRKFNANPLNDSRSFAFTLAEVLITLTIIGVIATLTIPNLMQKWQKEATVTKVKKAYNILSRAATNIKINSNCNDLSCTGLYNIPTSWNDTKDFLIEFTKLAQIKDYKLFETNGTYAGNLGCTAYEGCPTTPNVYFTKHIITQDGLLFHFIPVGIAKHISADGKAILVAVGTEKRKITGRSSDKSTYILGKNMFLFTIYDEFRIEPVGYYGTSNMLEPMSQTNKGNIAKYCNPITIPSTSNGTSCAAKILLDGWKINY